jgi:cysteinyl-tRNA synthetase
VPGEKEMRRNAMQLFNSLSQQIETFVAQNDEVKLYVCGITPYDTGHLGHAFVFATFDILVRYLRSKGLWVVYVENVTDIDDPLFERARELGNVSWEQLAQQETERFVREMHAINVVVLHKLLKNYSADAIRLLLAGHHYRQGWEFAITAMEHAQRLADQLAEAARGEVSLGTPSVDSLTEWTNQAFLNALENDLDTPRAVHVLGNLVQACLAGLVPDHEMPVARQQIRSMAEFLGLRLDKASE